MSQKTQFELMANYNKWINKNIYQAASRLNNQQLMEDRGAFFGSIHATLNHILVGDIIWLKRFATHPEKPTSLRALDNIIEPQSLGSILYSSFDKLQDARIEMDELILHFTKELSDGLLSDSLSYRNTKGDRFQKNFADLLMHLFNHQTHHRGQVSTLLSQLGIQLQSTDLVMLIPNE